MLHCCASMEVGQLGRREILPILREVEEKALDLFEKYDDKDFSFTDCVSFVIMCEMGIREVFGFDRRFDQMKLVRKPVKKSRKRLTVWG